MTLSKKTATKPEAVRLDPAALRFVGFDASDLATLSNSQSPALRRAFAELPRWSAGVARVNVVAAASRDFWAAFARHDLAAEIVGMAHSGTVDVDRLRQSAEAAGLSTAAASHATAGFESALRATGDQLRSAADPDSLRASLHRQLLEVLAAVEALPASTRRLRTAEDAIAADDVAGWRELDRLHSAYLDVRTGARMVNLKDPNTSAGHIVGDRMAALFANVLVVWPAHAYDKANLPMRDRSGRRSILRPPWPHAHSELPGQRRDEIDSLDFLGWLIESDARPWVPSADEYTKACAAVNAAVVQARASDERERAAVVESNGGAAA